VSQQLHFFNPSQTELDLELPKRGNPNFKNKYFAGKTKPVRIPIALVNQVQNYLESLEIGSQQSFIPENEVCKISVTLLNLDPKRFQYKLIHGSTGSTGSLREIKQWDSNLAGLILVWRDPFDGKTYVVNGHNRVTLAMNLGVSDLWVRYINADTDIEARAIGALANIADDKGTAIDAGKFFRDRKLNAGNLPKNIDMKKTICSQGLAIANLHDDLFDYLVQGEMSLAIAVAIGETLSDRDLQVDLYELLKKEKRNISADVIRELADIVLNASRQNSVTLFDLGCFMASNALHLAELQAYIKHRLSRDRRLFRTVAKSRNAESLSRANNHIDRDKSAQIADESDYVLRLFDELKAYKNSVTQLLNEFADRLGNGENCKDDCYTAICEYLTSVTLRDLAA